MKLQHLYRDQDGATVVEYTILVGLLLSLTFGIIQAGLMLWTQVGLQHGVEMAARCASVSDIASNLGGLNLVTNPTPCYTVNGNATANASTVKSFAAIVCCSIDNRDWCNRNLPPRPVPSWCCRACAGCA
jgi:Flp pilus assembly protein TadG